MTDSTPVTAAPEATAPAPGPTPGNAEYPGRTLGVVALVLAFFMQLPALIMGVVAWNWSNRAGVSNTPAKAAVFVSIGFIVLGIIAIIGWFVLLASLGDFLLDPTMLQDL